ncbi:unnamed protein product [Chilo suppressalis]|uniref:TOG domain-containing protein n=1 Tax=Chilo suppressalis TaxID=168631 RepID=A0ABN8B4X7_CHISP|nr:unnamed protein product [Chilo suppressalis]
MPKRGHNDNDSDGYIKRKLRKIEKKLRKRKKRSHRVISSSSSESRNEFLASPVPSLSEGGHESLLADSMELSEQLELPTQVGLAPTPGPSSSVQAGSDECTLDEEILDLLGATPTKAKQLGEKIQKDIALTWEHIVTSGISKEARKDLLGKHLVPENCIKLSALILNPEIKAALSDTMIGKDKASESKQNQIAAAVSCIGESLTRMLSSEQKDPLIIKPLLEGAQLLCNSQFNESMKRRSIICATIKKDIKSQLYETEIDTHLFGEKLADILKAAKAINKSGSEIKAPKPKTISSRVQPRNLNSKPQLANSRHPVRRRQDPAAYPLMATARPPLAHQQRQYYIAPPPPPPPPLPPGPPLPPPQQQRSKQRPYQRR